MSKQNCWEYKNCGRQPGGSKVAELGVCPAAVDTRTDGINCGKNAGRACWAVTGTFCGGQVQGTFASKIFSCMNCAFYNIVMQDEGNDYQPAKIILHLLKAS